MRTLDDETLAALGHLNKIEYCREMARWSGPAGRIVEEDGVVMFAAGTDFPVLFNGVDRLDPAVPAADVIAKADEFFGGLGRGYCMNLRDRDEDADLCTAAEAAGLVVLTSSPEMVVHRPVEERPTPDDIELRWVADGAPAADFVAVADPAYVSLGMTAGAIAEAFAEPARIDVPWAHTVIAYRDGRPLATAQTVLSHGIAGVYCVATLEEARGQGLADLVTRAVTNRGFELGALANTLQASPMGEPIYLRMGYEPIFRYSGYVRFAPST